MRRPVVAAGVVLALALVGAGGFAYQQSQEAAQDKAAAAAVTAFAAAWKGKDFTSVPFADPATAQSFATTFAQLKDAAVGATPPSAVTRTGDTATGAVQVTWTLPVGGQWSYQIPVGAKLSGDSWVITTPTQASIWQPDLAPGEAVSVHTIAATRGDLLDRSGKPLMPLDNVYPVQIDPTRATVESVTALEKIVGEPAGSLVAALKKAQASGSKATIPVITYRETDFQQKADQLDALVGVIYPRSQQPLAVNREFGQPLLGSFGPVTAEIVASSKGRYRNGDRAGLSGLQGAFDATLAGTPGIDLTASNSRRELFTTEAKPGSNVSTTLDPQIQLAAEEALAGTGDVPSALVAIDVPTGGLLAVANRPAFGFNRAMSGQFPPGSAFKIATSYSLLSQKLVTPTTPVACPKTASVNGKVFTNFEGEELGSPTFGDDLVHSCNTAFVGLAAKLSDDALADAGKALGVGAGWAKGIGVASAFDGSIPANTGAVDKAAASIGQGRDLASPAALATMVSSVARGSYVPPLLISDPAPSGAADRTPVPLDDATLAQLRPLLRQVVTSGTATVLASAPGGEVSGKTGTAEHGAENPPKTHAWFVGWQGKVAFAVLVEDGRSGGTVAAPIAKTFLTRVAARTS